MSALQKQQENENDVSKENKKESGTEEVGVGGIKEEGKEQSLKKSTDYSPQNISNELIQLEREIAEMHHVHVEPSSPALAQRVENADHNGGGDGENATHGEKMLLEMQPRSRNSTPAGTDAVQEGEVSNNSAIPDDLDHETLNSNTDTALGHDDLIAVLKGIDSSEMEKPQQHETQPANQVRAPSVTDSELGEGVTIEGEGQFQIMEVVDDEFEDIVDAVNNTGFSATTVPAGKSFVGGSNTATTKLTEDEIRAMAMEQIAGLKGQGRRRKQDIKPIQYTALESTDLISSLGADWSDDDAAVDQADLGTKVTVASISKLPSAVDISKDTSKPAATLSVVDQKIQISPPRSEDVVKPKSKGGATHKSSTAVEASSSGSAKSGASKEAEAAPPPATIGFKRTRIIKRKIIWDPDAPETQFSYAQLVRNTAKPKQEATAKATVASSAPVATHKTQPSIVVKKEPLVKKSRPATPKDHVEKKLPRAATPSKIVSATTASKLVTTTVATNKNAAHSTKLALPAAIVKDDADKSSAVPLTPQVKRRSQTPVANGAGGKKKKVSELDRLMGDEGAVNMLNSLESELGKNSTEQSDEDKPHKPLMRSRAATISEKVTKREPANATVAPAVTKKEVPSSATAATSPKSKRTAKQKPSATWDYVYKQQASEDAMIIRRRSNSSYSSNASLHRSSLDGTGGGAGGNSGGGGGSTTKTNPSTPASSNKTETATTATKSASKTSSKSPNTRDNSLTDTSLQSPGSAGSSKQNTPIASTGKAAFEFAKPESKSNQKANRRTKSPAQSINPLAGDMKKATSAAGKRAARSPVTTSATVDDKEKSVKSAREETTTAPATSLPSVSAAVTSDVIVKKASKVAQIVFNTHKAKLNYTFTAQMMNKLVDILDKLSEDADCHVVVLTTNAAHFCHGVDFTDLTVGSIEKRKLFAVQLATAVKNYLKTLATFPKPLIAGVNGSNIGLGVTQLPLFDIVIASDKGSYETPYAKIGQVPEGYCIWNNLTKIRGTFKTKLFWLCEKLHSTESALSGLVNKLTSPSKVNEDAFITAKKIAAMSVESYRHMKKNTIHNHFDTILTALDEEFDTIIDQWTSAECYENFKKYLELGHF